MSGWQPIETAPRNGAVLEITALEPDGQPFEIWPMKWDPEKTNGMFPGVRGFWTTPDGTVTWNEDGDAGPTHWRPSRSAS